MARRSSHEQIILEWLNKESTILNSRKLLPSKKEIDIYLPRFKVGIEVNGSIWHSEAAGKTKYEHQNKFIEASKQGIKLLSFYDWEVKHRAELVKSTILREIQKSYMLQVSMTKRCMPTLDSVHEFLNQYCFFGDTTDSMYLCREDKKGLCSVVSFRDKGNYIVVDHYTQRNGLHIINGIFKDCDELEKEFQKPVIVKVASDHGFITTRHLDNNGYIQFNLSEPEFYYLQKDKRLPMNTTENIDGYTRVYDAGKMLFVNKKYSGYVKGLPII